MRVKDLIKRLERLDPELEIVAATWSDHYLENLCYDFDVFVQEIGQHRKISNDLGIEKFIILKDHHTNNTHIMKRTITKAAVLQVLAFPFIVFTSFINK